MSARSSRHRKTSLEQSVFEMKSPEPFHPKDTTITVVADISQNVGETTEMAEKSEIQKTTGNLNSRLGAVQKPTKPRRKQRVHRPDSEEITVLSSEELVPVKSKRKIPLPIAKRPLLEAGAFKASVQIEPSTSTSEESTMRNTGLEFHKGQMQSRLLNLKYDREPGYSSGAPNTVQGRWKRGIARVISESREAKQASVQESADFFCKKWSVEEAEADEWRKSSRQPILTEDEEAVVSDRDPTETAMLLLQDLGSDFDSGVVQMVKASYVPWAIRSSIHNRLHFIPSTRTVPMHKKLEEGMSVRNLEEEGIYVGEKPNVASWNKNIMENRLLKQAERQWFGEDGQVKALPLPVAMTVSRPISPHLDTDLTVFCKPVPWGSLSDSSDTPAPWELTVELSSLTFSHHPLFSREHVLCSRLREAHSAHRNILLAEDAQQCLEHRLQALKTALNHLQEQLSLSGQDSLDTKAKTKRQQHYLNEMRSIRASKDIWEAESRTLLRSLLADWAELKRLRDTQGFTSTDLKLIVHQQETDREADLESWDQQLREELEEEGLLHEAQYSRRVHEYQEQLEDWKNRTKRSNSGRSRKRSETSLLDEESQDLSQEPETPEKFDPDFVMGRLREKALKTRRKPGEPKLVVELVPSMPITSTDNCPRSEKQRRTEVLKRNLMTKLFINEMEVCESSLRPLNQDFTVSWNQIYNVLLFHVPQTICIKILEEGSKGKELACVYLPIPEETVTNENISAHDFQFSSEQVVAPHHSAVGSGEKIVNVGVLSQQKGPPHWLLTGGTLRCSCAWSVDLSSGRVLAPIPKAMDQPHVVKLGQLVCMLRKPGSLLSKLAGQECDLDPNDPENARLIGALQFLDNSGEREQERPCNYFRLDPWETQLTSEQALNSRSRFQLLQLRAKDPEFAGYQMVPAYDSQIPKDVLLSIRKSLDKEAEGKSSSRSLTAVDKALKQLQKAREQVRLQYQNAQRERTLEDMVMEDKVPTIGSLGFNLLGLLRRRRPLRPKRKERKKMTGQGVSTTEVKVLVTVMRATNVPVRTDRDTLLIGEGRHDFANVSAVYQSQVQPFVEIVFQRESVRTSVAEGPHPTWNEQLSLRFKAPNDDYSPSSLEKVNESIHLNLFDEVVVDLLEDVRDRESTIHQKLERRWLGCLTLPFSTLYLNTKIEGTFQVSSPPVLLGYEPEATPWFQQGQGEETGHNATCLSLFFTLEPSLQLPDLKDRMSFPTTEPFLRRSLEWQSALSSQHPSRPIKIVTLDLSGLMTPITRYLRPLEPPEALMKDHQTNLVATMDLLSRFVSLIPNTPDSFIPGIGDIWTTCDHFLEMLSGDEEEHALLLCNFFLYLGLDAFLLLGSGIPEGPTAYVLCPLPGNESILWVWNATTGHRFPARDPRSPLQRVGCLASPFNVWANVQKNDHPSRMSFDIAKSKSWKPFFTNKFPHPGFTSIQPERLNYWFPSAQEVESLRSSLESFLSEALMRWRRRSRTSWNRHCARTLAHILPRLEEQLGKTATLDSLHELQPILSSHKLCGFPLNIPSTEEEVVADAVYATGVHLAEGPGLQFALAVYLHPYPCGVLSVWVYVATLTPRR